jgi:hypothetical protein
VAGLPERRSVKIPRSIRQELFTALISLLLACANMRSPASTQVCFSDATPSAAGFVKGTVSRELASTIYKHVESRGRHTRLDWEAVDFAVQGWQDYYLPDDVRTALRSVHWASSGHIPFRRLEHVNIQEARAVKQVLKDRVAGG